MSRARARTRPLAASKRVWLAPGFLVGLWVAQLLAARLFALAPRMTASAAMGPYRWLDDGHRLRALAELLADHHGVTAAILASVGTSALFAAVFSIVAAPAILVRLSGERSLAALAEATGKWLAPVLVQSSYGLVFRALCTGLGAIPVALLGPAGVPLLLVFAGFPIVVLDRARAAVVLEGDRPYHPMTFIRAIGHVAVRPLWWTSGAIIDAAKLAVGVVALAWVLSGNAGPHAIWLARGAGLLAVALGLWRVSLAVEGSEPTPR